MRDDFERGFSAEPRYASRRFLEPLGEGAVVFNSLLVFAGLIPRLPMEALSHATGITSFSQVFFSTRTFAFRLRIDRLLPFARRRSSTISFGAAFES